jgi:hypothetical protein
MSADTIRPSESSGPTGSEGVAARAARVREFFRDDWSRLRTLIMRLEEQSWQHAGGLSSASRSFPEPVENSAGTGGAASATRPGLRVTSETRTVEKSPADQAGRLNELARMLEQRIRSETAGRK